MAGRRALRLLSAALVALAASAAVAAALPAPGETVTYAPDNDSALIYNTIGKGNPQVGAGLDDIAGILGDEGYHVRRYGPGGGAADTVANFIAMSKLHAALMVIASIDKLVPTYAMVVEVDKTDAQAQAALARAPGASRWFVRVGHVIGVTQSGLAHYFTRANFHHDLVVDLACNSSHVAPTFSSLTFLGFRQRDGACPQSELSRSVQVADLLFNRMSGQSGVENRSALAAWDLQGFASGRPSAVFTLGTGEGVSPHVPVLSPAVTSASVEGESAGLTSGGDYPGSVSFDAVMDSSAPASVISVSGCGASITNPTWTNADTTLDFTVHLPDAPAGGQMTFTVDHSAAHGEGAGLPNEELSGNESPSPASGEAPNRTDYSWQASCDPDLIPVKIQITGTFSDTYHNPQNNNPGLGPFDWHSSYTWTVTQFAQIRFRGSAGDITPGSGSQTLTGSGTATSNGQSSSCALAAASATPNAGVESAAVSVQGTTTTRTVSVYAYLPQTASSGCSTGAAPWSQAHPAEDVYAPVTGPASLQNADMGQMTADVAQLEVGPVTMTYPPVDYTASDQDGTGGVDHVTATATETISLASS